MIQLVYGVPAIIAAALSEFTFSLLQAKWHAVGYLLFCRICLAVLVHAVGLYYRPGTENFAVLVYPSVAVGMLYMIKSFARQQA